MPPKGEYFLQIFLHNSQHLYAEFYYQQTQRQYVFYLIHSAVIVYICLVTGISATVTLIGVKFCTMVHDTVSLFWGGTQGIPKLQNFGPLKIKSEHLG